MSRRLVLWRHGRTAWNVQGRIQGQSDTELDEVGAAQAVDSARRLAALRPAAVVSSDLRRAADTADALSGLTGLTTSYDPRLREVSFGVLEGMTADEARLRWPAEMARRDASGDVSLPGAEKLAETAKRFAAAMRDVTGGMAAGDTTVVVAGMPAPCPAPIVGDDR